MAHTYMGVGNDMNETFQLVSHVTHMNESCHTYE